MIWWFWLSPLGGCVQIPLSILRMCAMLNPYGVKVRYPQDMAVGIQDARAALEYSQEIKKWADALIGVQGMVNKKQ